MTTASTRGATQTTGATISEPVFTTHTVITGTVITTVMESILSIRQLKVTVVIIIMVCIKVHYEL